jgi:hypothetical protein
LHRDAVVNPPKAIRNFKSFMAKISPATCVQRLSEEKTIPFKSMFRYFKTGQDGWRFRKEATEMKFWEENNKAGK